MLRNLTYKLGVKQNLKAGLIVLKEFTISLIVCQTMPKICQIFAKCGLNISMSVYG